MLRDIDRIVYETPSVRLGAFRCPASHQFFADSGPIEDFCFVFPRTPVVIQHKDDRPFAADPTLVTLYNKGQEYRRYVVSPAGDRCDWYGVSEHVLRDALMAYDPGAATDIPRPIRFSFVRIDAETYLLQRQLFARVSREAESDPFFFEEAALGLLDRTLAGAYGDGAASGRPAATRRAADDIAHDASELIGRRFAEPLTLTAVAAAIGTSLFHLCRSFRRSTGTTLHEYRNQLRLRTSLDRLEEDGGDLSQLALELGYSSHSHFTASFRRAFGVPPSAARRSISAIS